jgi:hypothetical protein
LSTGTSKNEIINERTYRWWLDDILTRFKLKFKEVIREVGN